MSEAQELGITPPPALGPPIIGTDPGSIPGIAQPVFAGGSATVPATPLSITGTPILPPPQVGFGNNQPASPQAITPAAVPPSVAGYPQPQYATGSGTTPTAASLFPSFTAAGANPPIVLNATQAAGANSPVWIAPPPLPLPTTPGIAPIVLNGWTWGDTPPTPPVNLDPPFVTGSTVVGSVLTVNVGTWEGDPTSFTYQWYGPNGLLPSTGPTYTTVSGDIGTDVACNVTGVNSHGSNLVSTAPYGPITASRAAPAAAPKRPSSPPPRHTSRR